MQYLYYKKDEMPLMVRIINRSLGIDMKYYPYDGKLHPANNMLELFSIAESKVYDDVQIYISKRLQAYSKYKKKSLVGYKIEGWISLREYKNGGLNNNDLFVEKLKDCVSKIND